MLGKEYNHGNEYYKKRKNIFEGEFKIHKNYKKRWNEYDDSGNLIFEEFYQRKRWNGKEKEYDINNNLIFEGEYLNGKIHGKEYDEEWQIIFEGEYKTYENSRKRWNGKGIQYEYKEGKITGEEIEYEDEDIIIKVQYKDGKRYEYIEEKISENKVFLIKGSKQKGKRIQLNDKYEEL